MDSVPETPENDAFRALLQKAVENIGAEDGPREEQYNFAARWSKIHHALSMYSVRPSPSNAAALDQIMEEIIPKDLDVESSVGLPVRGTYRFYRIIIHCCAHTTDSHIVFDCLCRL